MNKKKFEKEMKTAKTYLDVAAIKRTVKEIVDKCSVKDIAYPRGHRNLIIAMEEFAEVTKEITKVLRGKEDHVELVEELADAYLSIAYVQEVCHISDEELNKAINVKIDRGVSELSHK